MTQSGLVNSGVVGRVLKLLEDKLNSNYHRVVYKDGHLNDEYPGGKECQVLKLKEEGIEFDIYGRVKDEYFIL